MSVGGRPCAQTSVQKPVFPLRRTLARLCVRSLTRLRRGVALGAPRKEDTFSPFQGQNGSAGDGPCIQTGKRVFARLLVSVCTRTIKRAFSATIPTAPGNSQVRWADRCAAICCMASTAY
jgi:hypothetical protein